MRCGAGGLERGQPARLIRAAQSLVIGASRGNVPLRSALRTGTTMLLGRWGFGEGMFGNDGESDRRPTGNGDDPRVASAIHVRLLLRHGFWEGFSGLSIREASRSF